MNCWNVQGHVCPADHQIDQNCFEPLSNVGQHKHFDIQDDAYGYILINLNCQSALKYLETGLDSFGLHTVNLSSIKLCVHPSIHILTLLISRGCVAAGRVKGEGGVDPGQVVLCACKKLCG